MLVSRKNILIVYTSRSELFHHVMTINSPRPFSFFRTAVTRLEGFSIRRTATATMYRSLDGLPVGSVVFWQEAADAQLNFVVTLLYSTAPAPASNDGNTYKASIFSGSVTTPIPTSNVCNELGSAFPVSYLSYMS